jgi:transglutaminase-like putative cysteine protease
MSRLVKDWKKSLPLRTLTLSVIADTPGHKNFLAQVQRVRDYVRGNIAFVKDINGVETIHTPEMTIRNRAGDCDDQSVLVASMLESIGHPTRFVAIKMNRFGPFVHVFTETRVGNRWLPVETTENWPVGMQPPKMAARMIVHN